MQLPPWLVWYKKPDYRDIREYATEISSGKRAFSPEPRGKITVPSRLRLERILANKTCSPMSFYDFYMYLKYIEFSPENLEFYVWFKNYEKAYQRLGITEKEEEIFRATFADQTAADSAFGKDTRQQGSNKSDWDPDLATGADTLAHISKMISMNVALSAKSPSESMCPLEPPSAMCSDQASRSSRECQSTTTTTSNASPFSAENMFNSNLGHGAELRAVVKTYLMPGSEKELNVPPATRDACLRAIQHYIASSQRVSTVSSDSGTEARHLYCHPDHLRPVADHVYGLLKNCSHRNFVRLGVSNGTYETVCVATSLGIVLTTAGFLCILLRALYPFVGAHSRWNAFAPWPLWWIGMAFILSGLRGSCFFLLLFSRRQPLPWERFDDDSITGSVRSGLDGPCGERAAAEAQTESSRGGRNAFLRRISRLMIFDRKLKVKDTALRRLQTKIVVQSLAVGALFASTCVLVFIWLPCWVENVHRG
ncbi:hypothetical protein MCOR30_005072 [Pyricularia oryzae]|uniref:RGS domain-containing protein n=1 Tax=Pyricularia grisea TaxID=148305 RepID=A0ABQ8NY58_PYRGI|nr:hypothetical protein MCOR33_001127 [Pyricularia grisea]KAI6330662.1 hypothetical protein MCOR30_005072 [Pyricularia oryzae]KAI6577017.1 hypothetical protein MCOR09_000727 [Pyricularia oryzae]KAI6583750.1 hypothetical protein MCOR12_010767 [Pyricularia oryzae]